MYRHLAPVFAVVLLALTGGPVLAQANSPTCQRLQGQLAALDRPPGDNPALRNAYGQQRAQLDKYIAQSRGMGCGRSFLFGPRPPPECRGLEAAIDQLKNSVERLEAQLQRGRGGDGRADARRRDVLAALAYNNCGAQYQAQPQEKRNGGGLFGLLFGNRPSEPPPETYPDTPPPAEVPRASTFRTVCVRTCDGFFFPVNFAAVSSRFEQDEAICRRTCPGTQAELFTYPNPGGTIQQATSATSGEPYTQLPNAFKYQKQFVKDCSCRPANMSWAEALSGTDDDTVQRGDIVVDEERAKAMSQPQGASGSRTTPSEAARAAQDSARSVTTEGVSEAPAGDTGDLDEAPRTAAPIYASPPAVDEPVYAPPR